LITSQNGVEANTYDNLFATEQQ